MAEPSGQLPCSSLLAGPSAEASMPQSTAALVVGGTAAVAERTTGLATSNCGPGELTAGWATLEFSAVTSVPAWFRSLIGGSGRRLPARQACKRWAGEGGPV
jgi:hypothetical protein